MILSKRLKQDLFLGWMQGCEKKFGRYLSEFPGKAYNFGLTTDVDDKMFMVTVSIRLHDPKKPDVQQIIDHRPWLKGGK